MIDFIPNSAAATEIKRVVRGHWGRCEFRIRRQDRWESRQRSLYNYFIIQIQKCYRGFHSRKYRQNHFARRAYFKQIAEKNEEVLKMMAEYAALQETVRVNLIELFDAFMIRCSVV